MLERFEDVVAAVPRAVGSLLAFRAKRGGISISPSGRLLDNKLESETVRYRKDSAALLKRRLGCIGTPQKQLELTRQYMFEHGGAIELTLLCFRLSCLLGQYYDVKISREIIKTLIEPV
jgi:hypothetical protein